MRCLAHTGPSAEGVAFQTRDLSTGWPRSTADAGGVCREASKITQEQRAYQGRQLSTTGETESEG